jgi:release factor glutamine methyltransferase
LALTLRDLHRRTRQQFEQAGLETPDLDARLLIEHFTGTSRLDALSSPDKEILPDALADLGAAISRRMGGEPVHRILGYRDFYGLRLKLSAETLEPRPDTETLVAAVLPLLRRETGQPCRILDLGTGTGAVALALLSELPDARAVGVDVSDDALVTARRNAEALGLADRFEARRSDWFSDVGEKFRAIVSNPPYISTNTITTLQREVREFDPARALDGGADGLDAYRAIAAGSAARLEPDGYVAVEIGRDQQWDVIGLFTQNGFDQVGGAKDLAGIDRALVFQASPVRNRE